MKTMRLKVFTQKQAFSTSNFFLEYRVQTLNGTLQTHPQRVGG